MRVSRIKLIISRIQRDVDGCVIHFMHAKSSKQSETYLSYVREADVGGVMVSSGPVGFTWTSLPAGPGGETLRCGQCGAPSPPTVSVLLFISDLQARWIGNSRETQLSKAQLISHQHNQHLRRKSNPASVLIVYCERDRWFVSR